MEGRRKGGGGGGGRGEREGRWGGGKGGGGGKEGGGGREGGGGGKGEERGRGGGEEEEGSQNMNQWFDTTAYASPAAYSVWHWLAHRTESAQPRNHQVRFRHESLAAHPRAYASAIPRRAVQPPEPPEPGCAEASNTSSTYGQITSKNGNRTVTMALRLNFKNPVRSITCCARADPGDVSDALHAAGAVDPATLDNKVLIGYQGWFTCPTDGSRVGLTGPGEFRPPRL